MQQGTDARRPHTALAVVLLAGVAYALLNALKPLHVDDPFTWYVSQQILRAPLDPYGFDIYWFQWPQPCSEDLLAPGIAYWGALGMLVAGASDLAWKLTLLPLALLFAFSFHRLARRFALGLETPLLLMTLFSPLFLPSLNYMADVPGLALGLSALALYLHAQERGRLSLVLAAGLLAGVAMQTKYTMFSIPGAMLLHALVFRRLRHGVAAGAAALAVFVAWEAWVEHVYGHSMFATNVQQPIWWMPRNALIVPGLELMGAGLWTLALLGLAAVYVRRGVVLLVAAAGVFAHAALLSVPREHEVYLSLALLVVPALIAVAAVRLQLGDGAPVQGARWSNRRTDVFLVGWLLLEAVSYFQLSYFAAARRLLPFSVPATLLFGRAAALAPAGRRLGLWPLVGVQIALGLATFGVDLIEARTQRDAAREVFQDIRSRDGNGEVWFTGHWGFQRHAEALGMRPLVPDYTEVKAGDWVVVPSRVSQQAVTLDPASFKLVRVFITRSTPQLWTSYGFYGGGTPLAHANGPRARTLVYRALQSSIPPSGWTVEQSADWAFRSGGRQAGWARRALARDLEHHPRAGARRTAARALGSLGPLAEEAVPALERAAASDREPMVRDMAAAALLKVRGVAPEAP